MELRLFTRHFDYDNNLTIDYSDFDTPFSRWDSDRVAAWLHHIGLSMYVGECKRWVRNGDQLLRASSSDLEKVNMTIKFQTKFTENLVCNKVVTTACAH